MRLARKWAEATNRTAMPVPVAQSRARLLIGRRVDETSAAGRVATAFMMWILSIRVACSVFGGDPTSASTDQWIVEPTGMPTPSEYS